MQTIHKCLLMLTFLLSLASAVNAQTAREFIEKGVELTDAGHFAEAVAQYEAALKLEPKNSTAHYEIANTLVAMEKYDAAIDHAETIIKLKSGNEGLAYTILGTSYDLLGKPKKAIKAYEEGIKVSPNDYNLYYNLAITQFGQNDLDKAEKNFMASAKLNPKHANSHYALASVELEKDQKIKAMLPLYAYLRLNAVGKRALNARELLEKLYLKGVSVSQKGDNVINISLGMPNTKEEFGSEESTLTLMGSIMSISLDKKLKDSLKIVQTPEGRFASNTETLFSLLSKKDKKVTDSFWQTNYVDMFKELYEAKHVAAFCYSIYGDTEGVKKWQKENADKVAAYKEWLKPKTNLVPMGSKAKN
jgi:tetratricopeptide (TPR) repeat protein